MKQTAIVSHLIGILMVCLCIQAPDAKASGNSPDSVIQKFASAYFMLDASMAKYMSRDARINENGVDMVDLFLWTKAEEAKNQGYRPSYLQMKPLLMKTRVVSADDDTTILDFDAVMIRSINPLYRIVGYLFGMLEEHPVTARVTLVKEAGQWKVGPGAFDMAWIVSQ
jgi:hypothetical protein